MVFAGHLDTVPAQDNLPGRIEDGARARPRRERHEGRARGDDRARALGRGRPASSRSTSASSSSRARRSPVEQSPLPRAVRRRADRRRRARRRARADRQRDPGRLRRQPQRAASLRGPKRAHGAAVARRERDRPRRRRGSRRVAGCAPHDVEIEGLVFREVLSVTRIDGGRRGQRHPGPRRGDAELPLRAGPLARGGRGAAARARPAPTSRSSATRRRRRSPFATPLVQRLREVGGFDARRRSRRGRPSRSSPSAGLDAVNFGPGATRYAHTQRRADRDRRRSSGRFDALRVFLGRLGSRRARLPRPRRSGRLSVRADRGGEAAQGRRGRPDLSTSAWATRASRRDPLIKTRPRGGARRGDRLPDRGRACPSCARRSRRGRERRFGVELDPARELIPTLRLEGGDLPLRAGRARRGRRQGRRARARARLPGATSAARSSPAPRSRTLPLLEENGFLPDLDAIDDETWSRTALVWVCYPNNPTGAVAPLSFYERAGGARARARRPRLLRRGVHRALVRRAAGVGAAGRATARTSSSSTRSRSARR